MSLSGEKSATVISNNIDANLRVLCPNETHCGSVSDYVCLLTTANKTQSNQAQGQNCESISAARFCNSAGGGETIN